MRVENHIFEKKKEKKEEEETNNIDRFMNLRIPKLFMNYC